jgi:hypothetical protein
VPSRDVPAPPAEGASLKRDPALVDLSRDHHHALVQALALRRAREAAAPAAPVAAAFLGFVASDLDGHFADEEAELLPTADAVAPEESARVREEHAQIREGIQRLRDASAGHAETRALLGDLGDLLHDHVRYEERTLFECLQERLSPSELADLGRRLEARRRAREVGPGCRRRVPDP